MYSNNNTWQNSVWDPKLGRYVYKPTKTKRKKRITELLLCEFCKANLVKGSNFCHKCGEAVLNDSDDVNFPYPDDEKYLDEREIRGEEDLDRIEHERLTKNRDADNNTSNISESFLRKRR